MIALGPSSPTTTANLLHIVVSVAQISIQVRNIQHCIRVEPPNLSRLE